MREREGIRSCPAVTYLKFSGDGADGTRGVLRDVKVAAVLKDADDEPQRRAA